MKYRIRIVTYRNGRKVYYPQLEIDDSFFIFKGTKWVGLDYQGRELDYEGYDMRTRAEALDALDKHFKGNTDVQTIEFEYITK